jgi:phosphocarrier protein
VAEKIVIVCNELGVHARAAAAFVRLSNIFECDIWVSCRDVEVDGKSIMGVMMLAAAKESELGIRAEGTDSQKAVDQLAELVASRFGEER